MLAAPVARWLVWVPFSTATVTLDGAGPLLLRLAGGVVVCPFEAGGVLEPPKTCVAITISTATITAAAASRRSVGPIERRGPSLPVSRRLGAFSNSRSRRLGPDAGGAPLNAAAPADPAART